jgi:hypothetical protein
VGLFSSNAAGRNRPIGRTAIARYRPRLYAAAMGLRTRKFIGIVATVSFLIAYCLIAMAVGAVWLADAPGWLQLGYYLAAGLAWLPAVMAIIRWMSRPVAGS